MNHLEEMALRDLGRALFEGLTDYDSRTLKPVAGVAARWESAEDDRVWTFHLRAEARWSNGDPVTADDFVRSWRRTLRLGEDAPHAKLLANLVEQKQGPKRDEDAQGNARGDAQNSPQGNPQGSPQGSPPAAGGEEAQPSASAEPARESQADGQAERETVEELAVEAVDNQTLRVRLRRPDKNFPELVAHPVFRPVHASAVKGGAEGEDVARVALAIASPDQIHLERRVPPARAARGRGRAGARRRLLERGRCGAERVRFVGARDTEAALSAYRAGEVDAVTNARVEPLGLKLLASYKDFRRATFGALTYYDFNATRPPFDDARVREALARAIDRRRLTADTLEGAAEPAESFLPARETDEGGEKQSPLSYDPARRPPPAGRGRLPRRRRLPARAAARQPQRAAPQGGRGDGLDVARGARRRDRDTAEGLGRVRDAAARGRVRRGAAQPRDADDGRGDRHALALRPRTPRL